MAAAAILALVACGCLAGPRADEALPPPGCQSFAACLFTQDEALAVVVHSSPGTPFPHTGLTALADQVSRLAGRGLAVHNGSAVGPLPDPIDDAALRRLTDPDPSRLEVFVLATTRLEGDDPTSGLSFPGSPAVFLFPETLDFRVEEAGLEGSETAAPRAVLEAVVLVHEFGHALGLVGCGIPMQAPHADGASPCHSANVTSLMHARVARIAAWPAWSTDSAFGPFAWDAHDLADLEAFRDAARRDR